MMTEKNEMTDGPDDLPGWVQFWVPPSRKPTLAFAVLAVSVVATWLPILLAGWVWGTFDAWWWVGAGNLGSLWIILAVAWMYRHGKWR
jgi:hypothetical protein